MERYKPQQVDDSSGLMMVALEKCPICGEVMLDLGRSVTRESLRWWHPFPLWFENNLEAQMKRAGWRWKVCSGGDHEFICSKCVDTGVGVFTCALCGQKRELKDSKEKFGDPPEHLCVTCYESVSAKAWDDACQKLEDKHRYDSYP